MHRCRGAVEGSKRCSSTIKVESAAVATFGQLQPPHEHFRGARGGGSNTGRLESRQYRVAAIGAGRQPRQTQRVDLCEGQGRHFLNTSHAGGLSPGVLHKQARSKARLQNIHFMKPTLDFMKPRVSPSVAVRPQQSCICMLVYT